MGDASAPGGKEVVLHLDEATANDLEDFLYCLFELVAADAPVPMPLEATQERLGRVYHEILRQLGHWSIAEAMQVSLDQKEAIRQFVGRPDLPLEIEGFGRWHLPILERALPAQLVLNEFETGDFRVDKEGRVREANMSPEVVPLFGTVPAEGAPIDRPTARRAAEAFLAGRLEWFSRLELCREETENRGLAPGGYAYKHHQFSWEARHGPHRAWGLGSVSVSVDSVGSLVQFVQWPPTPVAVSLEPFVTRDEAIALALARYGKPITASEAELHVSAEALYWIVGLTGTEPWSNDNTRLKGSSYFIDAHTGANR